MTPREYADLQDRLEQAKQKLARMEGAEAERQKQLETEFGIKSLAEVKKLAGKLRTETEAKEKKADKALQEFETEYGERMES